MPQALPVCEHVLFPCAERVFFRYEVQQLLGSRCKFKHQNDQRLPRFFVTQAVAIGQGGVQQQAVYLNQPLKVRDHGLSSPSQLHFIKKVRQSMDLQLHYFHCHELSH
ncbi:MAG: hypothetical protein ABT02_09970 [Comamonadaceae bacterium SCN 68-20]|nr:MAG: hypothetical protein ABT02_09970 [Comamonadaceae bacterium SCN 68-20]OJX10974.1 MAG: hypothetical protein BGO75_12170 [Burkholderiales bacterium 68-20]